MIKLGKVSEQTRDSKFTAVFDEAIYVPEWPV